MIVLSVILILYLFCICPALRRHPYASVMKEQKLFAHRGLFDNAGISPENSMPAFRKAVEAGFGIETDIQLTKDGIPVLHHDFACKRTLRDRDNRPVKGKIPDYTCEELMQFHILNSEEKVPTLAEFLETVDGKVPLILEYKIEESDRDCRVCAASEKLLETYNGQYCIESFNPRGVLWYRKNRPDIMRGQLSDAFYHKRHCSFIHFLCAMLCFNFLTKPDFIAYDVKYAGNVSRMLCHGLYRNTAVCWTVRSEQQLVYAEKHFDVIIFDSFLPDRSA